MSDYQCSPQELRNASSNAATIANAITNHPVRRLATADFGHAGVSAALATFREAWANELTLRQSAADGAQKLLANAAADTERVDALLAEAISRISGL